MTNDERIARRLVRTVVQQAPPTRLSLNFSNKAAADISDVAAFRNVR